MAAAAPSAAAVFPPAGMASYVVGTYGALSRQTAGSQAPLADCNTSFHDNRLIASYLSDVVAAVHLRGGVVVPKGATLLPSVPFLPQANRPGYVAPAPGVYFHPLPDGSAMRIVVGRSVQQQRRNEGWRRVMEGLPRRVRGSWEGG